MTDKPTRAAETLVEYNGNYADDTLTIYTEDAEVILAISDYGIMTPTGQNRFYLMVDHRYRGAEVALYLAGLKPGGLVRDLSTFSGVP